MKSEIQARALGFNSSYIASCCIPVNFSWDGCPLGSACLCVCVCVWDVCICGLLYSYLVVFELAACRLSTSMWIHVSQDVRVTTTTTNQARDLGLQGHCRYSRRKPNVNRGVCVVFAYSYYKKEQAKPRALGPVRWAMGNWSC